ncbi:MAG: ISKra4 family transposase, partial [Planctomycetes bacterium]|nr:ISKra4 family transposase [Planctomycetota bacterium]
MSLVSVLGTVRCTRGYYHCPHCHAGHFPWDAELGLSVQELTPGAEELVSLAGCLD